MSEETVEKLDQEITLSLQTIDSNLSYCFGKITKEIIPHVTRYGTVCEEIMDHASWLGTMFQQTGNVDLSLQAGPRAPAESAVPADSLFPGQPTGPTGPTGPTTSTRPGNDEDDEFHTANVTNTGHVLRLPSDSSDDDEPALKTAPEADGSTLQRQRRKRKVSLLLQQEYGSSSSVLGAPPSKDSSTSEYRGLLDSSPMKNSFEQPNDDESTKEPKPGTVIHFSTGS